MMTSFIITLSFCKAPSSGGAFPFQPPADSPIVDERQTAEADRAKQVALIAAAQDAETKAVELTVRAKAEKEAAEMQVGGYR